ncbi:MAG: hypothetical protein M0Q25_09000, partial [Sulfurospirillaceae bacterium]|nr:hypothetical protein [Sulfurospirillaceae bacterium]
MKNIIFLVLILNSYLFSAGTYNPAKDYLSFYTADPQITYYPISYVGTVWYNYTDGYGVEIYKGLLISSSYTVISSTQVRAYAEWYKIIKDYSNCPDGQEIIDGACSTPPPCDGTWDSDTDTCLPPPPDDLDDDSDGIPNKCDPNYVDFLTMDCDSNDVPNANDPDIDGDGLLNANDPNPYVNGSDSGTSDTPCPSTAYS